MRSTKIAPLFLSTSYFTGSASSGISMITLTSLGTSFPVFTLSKLMRGFSLRNRATGMTVSTEYGKEIPHQVAPPARGRQLPVRARLSEPALRRGRRREAGQAAEARGHRASQGDRHPARLARTAARRDQFTRQGGSPDDRRRQAAVAADAGARRPRRARDH